MGCSEAPLAAEGPTGAAPATDEAASGTPSAAPSPLSLPPEAVTRAIREGWKQLEEGQHQAAVTSVRPVVDAGGALAPYAALLLGQAVVEGELNQLGLEAAERLLAVREAGTASEVQRKKAAYWLARIADRSGDLDGVLRWTEDGLRSDPKGSVADELRWLRAQVLEASGSVAEVATAMREIWFRTPGSRWAPAAREAMERLEQAGTIAPLRRSTAERFAFLAELQRLGRHHDALLEAEALQGEELDAERAAALTVAMAKSHYRLRRNDEVARLASRLRERAPGSEHAPWAAVEAIRALRRGNRTAEIEDWVRWLETTHPRHPATATARYNWGVYLGNVVGPTRGLAALRRMVETPSAADTPHLGDALWKIAWLERRRGSTAAAASALDKLLEELPESGYRKAALYWQGRFLEARDRLRALGSFETVAREEPYDYYGRLAADRLVRAGRSRPAVNPTAFPPVDLLEDATARAGEQGYRNAVLLRKVGLFELAYEELASIPGAEGDPSLQFALAWLRSRSGDSWSAIAHVEREFSDFVRRGSRDPAVVPEELWEVAYPFPFRTAIERSVREAGLPATHLDPFLIAAIARRESRFSPTVRSSAGAVGVLQLLPSTAREVARRNGLRAPAMADLQDPEINVRLGVVHFADLIRRFDGEAAPALASYNAGLGAAGKWWKRKSPQLELDEWIEGIPYLETRLYVKKILGDVHNYRELYGSDAS